MSARDRIAFGTNMDALNKGQAPVESDRRNNIKDMSQAMQKSSSAAFLHKQRQGSPLGGTGNFFSNRNSQMSLSKQKQSQMAAMTLYQGGFSQTISSNTLRNSHSAWSFPKADRFNKIRVDSNAKLLTLPNTINSKASTFGYGDKNGLQLLLGKESPSPNSYRIRGNFEKIRLNNGKTFGLSHQAYAKVYIPNSKINSNSLLTPGPGTYESKHTLGSDTKKFTIKSRIKPLDPTKDTPPPNNYHPNYAVYEPNKYGAITFGFGTRCNVNGQIKDTPGPGTYKSPSAFDKFKRLPPKEYLMMKAQQMRDGDKLGSGSEDKHWVD